jgi:stearoyl-CoA desaturase (delta-9 desaturase)
VRSLNLHSVRDPNGSNDVGYHRLWAHRSYEASLGLKIWLAAFGGGAIEDSIRTWSRDHRAHHRYTDTVKDPYSVRKGLLYAHIGWLVLKQNPKHLGRADVSDLDKDPIVIWQHKYYIPVALVMGFILPCCVAGLGWDDWKGGFVYAGVLRAFTVQQSTFCVNSVAHWLGDQTFDDRNSPRDHMITALITAGEGYHNFHHEFPSDYRNAIAWYQFDPTKWAIWLWKQFGLAQNLKQFRQNEIEKGRLQQEQKKLDRKHAQFQWTLEQLPLMEWEEYLEKVRQGRSLVVIAGVVHDVGEFVREHPGGQMFIKSGIGKDATATFNGGIHNRDLSQLQRDFFRSTDFRQILLPHIACLRPCMLESFVVAAKLRFGNEARAIRGTCEDALIQIFSNGRIKAKSYNTLAPQERNVTELKGTSA